ncbi:MAG: hypothetical protein ABIQ11_04980, partial [Saprospiraceae bacterium]
CAIAYWGVAMANYHPLWAPPTHPELQKGFRAVEVARSIQNKSARESAYIEAIGAFYQDFETLDHKTRALKFESAMEKIHTDFPDDREAAILYALSLDGAADPADTSFARQKKAGSILKALNPDNPDHPGLIHYIIHSYDYPSLAKEALPAARKYATLAPSSAHAQHMPSHIFTRLGLWDDCIQSNLVSTDAAKCYAESTGMNTHWDEEIHVLDYLMYAYLQKGDNVKAKELLDYLNSIEKVTPVNFKVAYAYAAMPARYVLENKMWNEAANLSTEDRFFSWNDYPWQKAIIHFARLLGNVHMNKIPEAKNELIVLSALRDTLVTQKDIYKANQVHIQMKAGEAWILWKEKGQIKPPSQLMNDATSMEALTQKHPVTPGEVLPTLELLGDMFMEMDIPDDALSFYEDNLKLRPNRFNSLYGAALAAEKSGKKETAISYYEQLLSITDPMTSTRPEIEKAKAFLGQNTTL